MTYEVLVIGSGRTARLVLEMLPEYDPKRFHIYSRTRESAEEAVSDLNFEVLDDLASVDPDVILDFSASKPNLKTTELGTAELPFNLESLTRNYGQLNTNADVFIYSNPVDVLTAYASILLGRKNVYGVGLELDVSRARTFLKRDDVKAVGLHNRPIILNSTADQEAVQSSVLAQLEASKASEQAYLETQSVAIRDMLDFIFERRAEYHLALPVSTGILPNFDAAIGYPVKRVDGEIVRTDNLTPNEKTLLSAQIQDTAKMRSTARRSRARSILSQLGSPTEFFRMIYPDIAKAGDVAVFPGTIAAFQLATILLSYQLPSCPEISQELAQIISMGT